MIPSLRRWIFRARARSLGRGRPAALLGVLLLATLAGKAPAAVRIEGDIVCESVVGDAKGKVLTSPFTLVLGAKGYSASLAVELAGGQIIPNRIGFDGQDCYCVKSIPAAPGKEPETHDYGYVNATSFPLESYLSGQVLWLAFLGENQLRDGQTLDWPTRFIPHKLNPGLTNLMVKKVAPGKEMRFAVPGLFKGYDRDVYRVLRATNFLNRVYPLEAEWTSYLAPGQKFAKEPATTRVISRYTVRVRSLGPVAEPATWLPAFASPMQVRDQRFGREEQILGYAVTNRWEPRESPRLQAMVQDAGWNNSPQAASVPPPARRGVLLAAVLLTLGALGAVLARQRWGAAAACTSGRL